MESKMRKEKELDRSIDQYLSNKSALPREDFDELVMQRIDELPSSVETGRRTISFLLPLSVTALAACILFFLLPPDSGEYPEVQDSQLIPKQHETASQLKEPEKELIEDLMVVPEKWINTETFPDEQTYELLVLLDI
jgi:hypothetical protein